jgi:hypothetical protein
MRTALEKRPARWAGALLALALAASGAGCGAGSNLSGQPGQGTTADTQSSTPMPTQLAPAPQPSPIAPGAMTTYTNTAYHYSIPYPHNWYGEGNTPTAQSFTVWNYDPQQYQAPQVAPPLLKIEVDAVANPSHQSPADFFAAMTAGPGQPPTTVTSSRAVTVAGRAGEEIISTTSPSPFPTVTYLVSDGDAMLMIYQLNAANGQPAPVFTRMVAGMKVTG